MCGSGAKMLASNNDPGDAELVLHPVDGPRLEPRVERVVPDVTELGHERPRDRDRRDEAEPPSAISAAP